MKFDYDNSADVLYLTIQQHRPSRCRFPENENGDVLWVDKETGEIVGVTIISFLVRLQGGYAIDVPEIGLRTSSKRSKRKTEAAPCLA